MLTWLKFARTRESHEEETGIPAIMLYRCFKDSKVQRTFICFALQSTLDPAPRASFLNQRWRAHTRSTLTFQAVGNTECTIKGWGVSLQIESGKRQPVAAAGVLGFTTGN
jgi:hypothetical protein